MGLTSSLRHWLATQVRYNAASSAQQPTPLFVVTRHMLSWSVAALQDQAEHAPQPACPVTCLPQTRPSSFGRIGCAANAWCRRQEHPGSLLCRRGLVISTVSKPALPA